MAIKNGKSGSVPRAVALSMLRVASVLAAVDGVYTAEEKKKLREMAKLFPGLKISPAELLELDSNAERIARLFANGGDLSDVFATAKTGVDVNGCLDGIVENPAWVYPAILVWIAICCCDGDYCAMERKAVAEICGVLSASSKIAIADSFVQKAEMHMQNLVYAEMRKAEIKDPFRRENLKDVINFEKALLTRMAAGEGV